MFTIENFPEEYFGYKVIDRNENVLFLEYSYSNIYWIKNKFAAVKFSGLDGRRLFIHTVEKDSAEKYKSTGCYAVENSRSVLSQFFDAVSVGEIDYSNFKEFTGVEHVVLTPKDMVAVIAEEECYHTNIDGDTVTVRKHKGDIRFVEIEFCSMHCVVKGVSESGNVLDMFNTCRTGFIVEYIKEFLGDYSNVRIGMVEARLDESING
ncbi:MAG: hypothetical protein HXO56_08505 [Rothia dentocariosa]|uniref:Uncharacterized protein n=1 Tax=Rothia dentocariosa TaxID=2047 RepID=A0A930KQX7_9MICC|nr:hypothetical protein [Rothia dentocariosa]